ncbi:hypothetical protein CEXT_568431 [Caerostris extrusa]|uniref:Ycf15 n=1 Tax=Caerostris extrusa TaxID=172846 RepID=A0AAV4YB86_CAEEX|nr:hypothetical protein CEXT_568431 [Caerostris extrusa]
MFISIYHSSSKRLVIRPRELALFSPLPFMHSSFYTLPVAGNRRTQFSPNWQSNGGIYRKLFWGVPFAERSGRLASDKASTPTPKKKGVEPGLHS